MKSITIAILTKDRVECVETLLRSLNEEVVRLSYLIEVFIVDDSIEDNSKLISSLCHNYKFQYCFFRGSISEKRNYALNNSNSEIILYIDSDCYITSHIITEHSEHYTSEDIGGVLGVVEFEGEKPFFWHVIEKTNFTIPFSFAKFMDYAQWGPCANISFKTSILKKIGGFKVGFPFNYSGEDVDIGLRVNKAGYKIKCNPNAIVNHDTITWIEPFSFIKKIFRWGRTDFYLMNEHSSDLYPEFPRFFPLSLLLTFSMTGVIFISCLKYFFSILIIWSLPPLIYCLLKQNVFSIKAFIWEFSSFLLNQVFEIGLFFEIMFHFKFDYLSKKILYSPRQLEYELNNRILMSYSFLFSCFTILLVVLW